MRISDWSSDVCSSDLRFLVDLLIRRGTAAGGFAAVLASGDSDAGAILVQCSDRGMPGPLLERRFALAGGYIWEAVGPDESADAPARAAYVDRRRSADPDLWNDELAIANAPRPRPEGAVERKSVG